MNAPLYICHIIKTSLFHVAHLFWYLNTLVTVYEMLFLIHNYHLSYVFLVVVF